MLAKKDMRHLSCKVGLVVVAIASAAMALASQAPAGQKPSFEVVSIKPNKSGGPTGVAQNGGRFVATNVWLQALLQRAYSPRIDRGIILRPNEIVGAPSWTDPGGERFDIEAKPEGNAREIPV